MTFDRDGGTFSRYRLLINNINPFTKAGAIEIRPLLEYQNYDLENVHITTVTLIKFAQKFVY